jgi:hypothetical protein
MFRQNVLEQFMWLTWKYQLLGTVKLSLTLIIHSLTNLKFKVSLGVGVS